MNHSTCFTKYYWFLKSGDQNIYFDACLKVIKNIFYSEFIHRNSYYTSFFIFLIPIHLIFYFKLKNSKTFLEIKNRIKYVFSSLNIFKFIISVLNFLATGLSRQTFYFIWCCSHFLLFWMLSNYMTFVLLHFLWLKIAWIMYSWKD